MPYKTKSGTHYHESYGCCGAIESCGTEGLEPCRICCGKSDRNGGGEIPDAPTGTGIPIGASAPGIFSVTDGPQDVADGRDMRVTTVETLRYEATDDYVMRLAESLLAIKASMDATRDGQYAPASDEVDVGSESLREVLDALPSPSLASASLPDATISPDDIAGRPMSPREAFEAHRQEEFIDDFRRRTAELIRRWDEDEWQQWREAREDLAQYMKGNLRRERPPQYSRFIDEEVESLLRRRYEDDVPCPDWHLASQWQRYGRLLSGHEERWPGYVEARASWDAESELLWQRMQARRSSGKRPTRQQVANASA